MSLSDPIAQMLTLIRNALKAGHATVDISNSKMKKGLASVLKDEGYIDSVMVLDDDKQGTLRLTLKYAADKKPVIQHIERYSKPGLRRYVGVCDIPRPLNGCGICVLSTPQGIKSGRQARFSNVGGEVLCLVW